MSVIPLTVFLSLLLAALFVVLFAREQRRRPFASPERDSLLPLADEMPLVKSARGAPPERGRTIPSTAVPKSGHEQADDACACRTGRRSPCVRCQRRLDEQEPAYF